MKMNNFATQQLILRSIMIDSANLSAKMVPALIFNSTVQHNELVLRTTPAELRELCIFVRNNELFQMTSLVDIQGVDRLKAAGRFVVKYSLLSTKLNQRCTIEVAVNEITPIPSIAGPFFNNQRIFASAG
jgi:NADH:ubiquinone oxidoreductase subunit C